MTYLSLFYIFFFFCVTSGYHHESHHSHHPRNIDRRSYNEKTEINNTAESDPHKVHIGVFYESLCPASIDFFVEQLGPAAERLGSHLDIHLVPYGHAKTRAVNWTYRFKCQHGPEECYGNKVHACVIDVMKNSTRSALMNSCLMKYTNYVPGYGYDYAAALAWCGYKLHFSYEGIRHCVVGRRGNILLKGYGDETHHLRPHYVPYVIVDGSTEEQDRATGHLVPFICEKLKYVPDGCRHTERKKRKSLYWW